jgi:hypothetical protein
MGLMPAVVEVHIDELVLEGAEPDARQAVNEAFQAELVRLVTLNPPSAAQDVATERVDGGALRGSGDAEPRALGAMVAQSVHQALAPGGGG